MATGKRGPGRPPQHDGHGEDSVRRITDEKQTSGAMLKRIIKTNSETWCIAKGIDRLRWIMGRGEDNKIKQIDIDTIIVFLAVGSMAYDRIDDGIMIEGRVIKAPYDGFCLKEFPNCLNLADPVQTQKNIRDSPLEKKVKNELDFLIKEELIFKDTQSTEDYGDVPVLRLTDYGDNACFQFFIDIQEDWPRIPEGECHKFVADQLVAGKPYPGEKHGLPKNYGDREGRRCPYCYQIKPTDTPMPPDNPK